MKIFKKVPQLNIMAKKKYAFAISSILLLLGFFGFFSKGIIYGIDFRGGTLIQVKFAEEPSLKKVRKIFQKKLATNINVTSFGETENFELLITLSQEAIDDNKSELTNLVTKILAAEFSGFDIRRVETVGPKVGSELRSKAIQAAIYALAGILIYIGIRFKFRYGIAAVIALFHDVMLTMGIFIILDKEFTLTILAALLTIIGYSLNDTIVVFDRIRENVARFPKKPFEFIINTSINESLSRTILTSVTTFFVVLAMFVLGGDIIHDFSLAMLIGIIVGTYSSIFVASPVVLYIDPSSFPVKSKKSK